MRYIILILTCVLGWNATAQSLKAAGIFGDNMVIQQQINAPVWGLAVPGEKIKIDFAGFTSMAQADASGKWMIRMPALPAGGPYSLTVSGSRDVLTFTNVMVGEVWLASGQSNMSFSVDHTINKDATIAAATFEGIREVHIPERVSGTPLQDLAGLEWKVCNPGHVKSFSAVAYFFARSLHRDKNVAVGIINSSNSGTPAEAWTSGDMLFTHPDFKQRILDLRQHPEDWAALEIAGGAIQKQYRHIIETTTAGIDKGVQKSNYDDTAWPRATYPVVVSKLGLDGYHLLWFRTVVDVPANVKGDLNLVLGKVIHQDITYFNGTEIGRTKREGVRSYKVPAKFLKKGKNVIAMRLLSEWGYGRIGNPGDEAYLASADGKVKIPLKGEWAYNSDIEPELPVANDYSLEPSSLFNAMIAPILPYGIRGALWYQGEGNSGKPQQYETLLPLLFTDWRTRWELGNFPFLIVQLPNYAPGAKNWVRMREVQARALQYPNTGLAITIDLGDPNDVHPLNKEPVGERLYKVASHVAYGESSVYTGPTLSSFVVRDNSVRVVFENTGSGLVLKNKTVSGGFLIAGADKVFYEATEVKMDGNALMLRSDKVQQPVAVRYAWSGDPEASLYNREGLPAAPFRTDTFEP